MCEILSFILLYFLFDLNLIQLLILIQMNYYSGSPLYGHLVITANLFWPERKLS